MVPSVREVAVHENLRKRAQALVQSGELAGIANTLLLRFLFLATSWKFVSFTACNWLMCCATHMT